MDKIAPKIMKIDSLIAGEAAELRNKFSFWGVNPAIDLRWPEDSVPADPHNYQELIATLQSIENIGNLPSEQQALIGVGWEFVWGVTPPEKITQLREKIRNKARDRSSLSDLELFWIQVMSVDTDSF